MNTRLFTNIKILLMFTKKDFEEQNKDNVDDYKKALTT